MPRIFLEEKALTCLMILCFIISMLLRVVILLLYIKLQNESENMANTEQKQLKMCKLKFLNSYKLNNGVTNIPVFVDKFLMRLSVGPFGYQTIYRVSGQIMLLSVFLAGIGICKSIILGKFMLTIIPFYIYCFVTLYLFLALSNLVDIKGRRIMVKTNLIDYLENHMSKHLGRLVYEAEAETENRVIEHRNRNVRKREVENAEAEIMKNTISLSEEKELETLLKEFLT